MYLMKHDAHLSLASSTQRVRIFFRIGEIAKAVGPYVVRKRLKEAFEQQYIVGPDIRKRSHLNTKEYT